MGMIQYSKDFQERILRFCKGIENLPNYEQKVKDHLDGPTSRLSLAEQRLCPEIQHHCGDCRDKTVLDFGCGTGASTAALAQIFQHVYAFDISEESIDICKRRIHEHGLTDKVDFYCAGDFDVIKTSLPAVDVSVMDAVLEHIPLSQAGLREKIVLSVFELLARPGYLVIHDTPNRLYPFDSHTTKLWWIPCVKPGSEWAFRRAIRKGRHPADAESRGPITLERRGAWGATYWEILGYLRGERFLCVNALDGHNRHIDYQFRGGWKRQAFEFATYFAAAKLLHIPITAFAPSLDNLVFKKY